MGLNKRNKSATAPVTVTIPKGKWEGKKWLTLGDSITDFDIETKPETGLLYGYQYNMKETMGFASYVNQGKSGKPMAGTDPLATHTVGKAENISDIDVITIFAGTNDFKLNNPVGSVGLIGDTNFDTATYCGAYRSLLEDLLTRKPGIKIYMWTPLQRDNEGYDVNKVNTAGHKLIDYVNACIDIGSLYGIPVLDLYRVSGFTKKTLGLYTWDGLHPSNAGYKRIAEIAKGFMETY
jgi:lysophospholipase L1-like esterase